MSPLFSNNNKTTIAELEEYYATQKKNSTSMAWFMSFVGLIVTIGLVVGLFIGGRGLYRTIVNNTDNSTVSITEQSSGKADNSLNSGEVSEDSNDIAVIEGKTNDSLDNTDTNKSSGVVSTEAATTERSTSSAKEVQSSIDTSIPNTGPGSSLAMITVVTIGIGYLVSILKYSKQK